MQFKATESYFRRTEMRIVTLGCGCTPIFAKPYPKKGEQMWCLRCNVETVVETTCPEFRSSCLSCPAGARFGRAEENAYRWAVRHRRRRPGHIVIVRDGPRVVYTFDNRGQLELAVGDEPNF